MKGLGYFLAALEGKTEGGRRIFFLVVREERRVAWGVSFSGNCKLVTRRGLSERVFCFLGGLGEKVWVTERGGC